jgi:hypothetical protein
VISLTAMAVWWEPTQAELADRNGESPFVLPEFLEESNFQHLYKALSSRLTRRFSFSPFATCKTCKMAKWNLFAISI